MLANEYNSSLLSRKIKVGYLGLRFNDLKIKLKIGKNIDKNRSLLIRHPPNCGYVTEL